MQSEAIFQGEQHGTALRRIAEADARQDLGDQGAAGAQALGELGPPLLRASGEQDQLDMQERRAAQRIAAVAVRDAKSGDEVLRRAVVGQKLAVMERST